MNTIRLVLGAFAEGSISHTEAMGLLGFEWYGQLLDAMRENGIDRVVSNGRYLYRIQSFLEEATGGPEGE